jgi:hypothetical protein
LVEFVSKHAAASCLSFIGGVTKARQSGNAMRRVLLLRGTVGLFFAADVLANPAVDRDAMFTVLSNYLLADGVLGVIVAAMLLRDGFGTARPRLRDLGVVLLVDGFGRIGAGIVPRIWPGTSGFPVTAVLFLGLVAAFTALLGLTEAALTTAEERARHGPAHARPQFAVAPVLFSSAASLAFGIAGFALVGDVTSTHFLLAAYMTSAGAVAFSMAWARRAREPIVHA